MAYLEILCLLGNQRILGGTFFVFSQPQCCPSKNLLCSYFQISSLPFLFSFTFSPFSPLCVGKVMWEGGQCWQGENGSMFMTPVLPKGETFLSVRPPWVCCPSLRTSKMSLPGGNPCVMAACFSPAPLRQHSSGGTPGNIFGEGLQEKHQQS